MKLRNDFFFDMDGTLARFYERRNTCLEKMYEKGFFAGLKPYKLVEQLTDFADKLDCWDNIYIISACVDTEWCPEEKVAWLHQHLPKINNKHIFLCPIGANKAEVIATRCNSTNTKWLIDDYGENIREWEQKGQGFAAIKFINGINNKKGNYYKNKARTMKQIAAISGVVWY